jgi:hypothetical protein
VAGTLQLVINNAAVKRLQETLIKLGIASTAKDV